MNQHVVMKAMGSKCHAAHKHNDADDHDHNLKLAFIILAGLFGTAQGPSDAQFSS